MANFLIKHQTLHKLSINNSPAYLFHDLDITEINHVRFIRVHNGENRVDGDGSEEGKVLTKNLTVKRSASGFYKRFTAGEFDGYIHGSEDINRLDRGFMKGNRDHGRVDAVREKEKTIFKKCIGDDDNNGGTITSGGVLRFGEFDEHLSGGLKDLHLMENGGGLT